MNIRPLAETVGDRLHTHRLLGVKTIICLLDTVECRHFGELHPDGLPGLCRNAGFRVASRIVEIDQEMPVMPDTVIEYVSGILAVAERPVLVEYSESVRKTGCMSKFFGLGCWGFFTPSNEQDDTVNVKPD